MKGQRRDSGIKSRARLNKTRKESEAQTRGSEREGPLPRATVEALKGWAARKIETGPAEDN